MNIGDLKKELELLGLSTATPGISGDERYEELKARLEEAHRKATIAAGTKSQKGEPNLESMDFSLLTIGELRSRLTLLGVSTTTPGLSGQERWAALKQRLIDTLCIREDLEEKEEDNEETEIILESPLKLEINLNSDELRRPVRELSNVFFPSLHHSLPI